jgi:hypothetical protein
MSSPLDNALDEILREHVRDQPGSRSQRAKLTVHAAGQHPQQTASQQHHVSTQWCQQGQYILTAPRLPRFLFIMISLTRGDGVHRY